MSSRRPNHHHHPKHYRQALSYNDQGIVSMRRRDYGEAIVTFQMALTIMREAISDVGGNEQMSTMEHRYPTATTASTMSTTNNVVISSEEEEEIMIMSSDTKMMIISTAKPSPYGAGCDCDKLWPIGINPPMIDRELLLRNVGGGDDNDESRVKWERTTVIIILYNIGLCKMKITTATSSGVGNAASLSSGQSASRLFSLAWQLIRGMIQRVQDHPKQDDTIPAWYGLHQIEMMILSAIIMCHHLHQPNMMMMVTPSSPPPPPWWLQHRKQQVQRVLKSHRDMITFLYMFTTNHPRIAPCA